jgi:hypothetical protein
MFLCKLKGMAIEVKSASFHMINLRTRFAFRYGIASMTALPQIILRLDMKVGSAAVRGFAAENLPPHWFTKNPETSFRQQIEDMLHVIESAADFAQQVGPAATVFDLWQQMYTQQMMWAPTEGYPPLLWSLGTSLTERALIDGFCRASGMPFHQAVRDQTAGSALGIVLGEMEKELMGMTAAELLPREPLERITVRHTVGLSDPVMEGDIAAGERVNDGLPQSLEAVIATHHVNHFKVKLCGDAGRDLPRLEAVAKLLNNRLGAAYHVTLDGNEQFAEMGAVQEMWAAMGEQADLAAFGSRVLWIEQPLHRAAALTAEVGDDLEDWPDRPPIIIDESDALLSDAGVALELGYAGTTHKNCKGVFKGIAHGCLIAHRNRAEGGGGLILSGEDLAIVGPIGLAQDLCVMATLGIGHVERNGHHYFRGLSMFPETMQQAALTDQPRLYHRDAAGVVALKMEAGQVSVADVIGCAGLGTLGQWDVSSLTRLDDWRYESLEAV